MKIAVFVLLCCFAGPTAAADEDYSARWNGIWAAEGTLFSVEVVVENGRVEVRQIESLGFQWSSGNASISGANLRMEVEYAGVSGIIEARLEERNRAAVFARSCLPEYMVVCVLTRGRQVLFRKAVGETRSAQPTKSGDLRGSNGSTGCRNRG